MSLNKEIAVKCSNLQLPMNTFGNSRHFWVAVPIKHMAIRNQNKKESELRLHFYWKRYYSIWLSKLSNQIIKLWYAKLIHFVFEKLIMRRAKELQSFEALVFCYYGSYQAQEILERLTFCKEALQKKKLLRLIHSLKLYHQLYHQILSTFRNQWQYFYKRKMQKKSKIVSTAVSQYI